MEEKKNKMILEDRKSLYLSDITDVGSFQEDQAEFTGGLGVIQITGTGLHLERFDLEKGEVLLTGRIDSIWFPDPEAKPKGSLFGRIFRG